MTARVLIVKNVQREGPGLLRDVLQEHHVGADVVEIERGDRIPPLDDYAAMFVLGGPASANDDSPVIREELDRVGEALAKNVPFFGVCLGMQLLAKAAGGRVLRADAPEIGFIDDSGALYVNELTEVGRKDPLFQGVPDRFAVFQLHGETIEPSDATQLLATSSGCVNQAIRVGRRAYGVQAHVEVVPEMLAVWKAQDPMLVDLDAVQLQSQLAASYEQYARVARRVFTNFLVLAGLAPVIDVAELEREATNVR